MPSNLPPSDLGSRSWPRENLSPGSSQDHSSVHRLLQFSLATCCWGPVILHVGWHLPWWLCLPFGHQRAPPALMVAILSLWMPELACGPGEKCPLPSRLYVGAQSDLARDSVVRPLRVPVFWPMFNDPVSGKQKETKNILICSF